MTSKDLLRGIGALDPGLIAEAEAYQAPKVRHWGRWAALAACVAIVAAVSWQVLPKLLTTETAAPQDTVTDNPNPTGDDTAVAPTEEADGTKTYTGESLGGVYLGMTQEEVEAVLGSDYEATEPREQAENYRDVCWYYPEINVRFVDEGEGWFVQELVIQGDSAVTLSTGIGLASTREEILAAYPDAKVTEETGYWSAYVPQPGGGLWMTLDGENGNQISLAAVDQTPPEILTTESIGGLKLGMSQELVASTLGTGYEESMETVLRENFRIMAWNYPEAELQFADTGDGFFLNKIVLTMDSPLTLSTGISAQSTAAEFLAAYPEAQTVVEAGDPYSDGVAEQYLLVGNENGGLRFYTDGIIYGIWLGPLVPEPEPIANLLHAGEIVVHGADGTEVTLIDKAAKKVSTVLTITDPEMASYPGESPKWWLDLDNGYYLAVYGHDDLATVYSGDRLDTTLATMTEELTGVFLDLDSTLQSALENPMETWE